MTSNTHPDPFPTLPPPHACMVKLNHSKIIPRKMRGICTLSQLYQCKLSVSWGLVDAINRVPTNMYKAYSMHLIANCYYN